MQTQALGLVRVGPHPPRGGDRDLPEAGSSPLLSAIWVTGLSCLVARLSWTDARSRRRVVVNTRRLGKPCVLKGAERLVLGILYGSEVWGLREDLYHRPRRFHNRCARTMCRIAIAQTIRHLITKVKSITTNSLFAKLEIDPLDTYYNRRLLRWAGHASRMPMSRVPRKLLTSRVAKPRPVGSPQMTWGRALNKALRAASVPSTFTKWRDLAAYRDQWRVLCGAKARGTVHTPPKHPRDIWAQVVDGPPPSNTDHPTTAPTRPRRQQPRTPAPTPELNATQKWWAAFMGDRAFARARAAGKNETEAGHARAKAEADISLSLPAEYRD